MSPRIRPLLAVMLAVMCAALATSFAGAAPAVSLAGTPVVVVFPFRTADGIDQQQGRDYAVALGNALQATAGLKVVMADPGTQRDDFLHVTAASGGDYYVTGASFLVFGVVSAHSTDTTTGVEPWTNADYTPMVYDCSAQAYNRGAHPIRSAAFDWKTAFDRATYKATTDFFAKLPGATPNAPAAAKHA